MGQKFLSDVIVEGSSKLGVGTATPSDKLHVQDGYVKVAYTGGAAFKLVPHSSNDGYGFYDAVNLNFDMWFDGGNVGVGTVSPLARLHTLAGSSGVSSVDTGTSAIIESNTTNYLRFLNPDASTGGLVWTSPSDNFGAFLRWGHSSGLLEIATANSNDSITFATGNASEKMRLTNTGLGIGTTSPNNALEVYGNADSGVARFRHTSNGAYGSILLGSVNRIIGDVGTYIFKNGSSELLRILSNGSVLIGTTTNTAAKLSINQSSATDPILRLTDDGVADMILYFQILIH